MKNHKSGNLTAIKAIENVSTYLNFRQIFMCVLLNLKTIKFHQIKLATDLYWQPSYFFGERA